MPRVEWSSALGSLFVRHYCLAAVTPGFLGYTLRNDRGQWGRPQRYWNLEPSHQAVAREREALRALTAPHQSHPPLPELLGRVNRQLRGWADYFGRVYPRKSFRHRNHFVRYPLCLMRG